MKPHVHLNFYFHNQTHHLLQFHFILFDTALPRNIEPCNIYIYIYNIMYYKYIHILCFLYILYKQLLRSLSDSKQERKRSENEEQHND